MGTLFYLTIVINHFLSASLLCKTEAMEWSVPVLVIEQQEVTNDVVQIK